jgi:hypothetical protein
MITLKNMAMVFVMAVWTVPLCAQNALQPPMGVSGSFKYSCTGASGTYYSIPIFHSDSNHPSVSLVFQSHQYKRYGNYKPPVLPICYDDETYFLMLDHVKDEITFDGSAHYPEFMQNIGAISCDNSENWREIAVTNPMKFSSQIILLHDKEALSAQADINFPGYPSMQKVQ